MRIGKSLMKLMAITSIGIMSITSFAAELPVLKLDTAVKSAVNTNSTVSVYEKQIKALNEQMLTTANIASTTFKSNNIQKQAYEQKITYIEDATAYDVTNLYNEIVLLKKQIAFTDTKLKTKEKELKQLEIKYKSGYISKLDYELAQSQIDEIKKTKVTLEANLEDARAEFNRLAKYDINYYTLEDNFEFEDYTYVGNVQRYFGESVDQMLKHDQELAELQQSRVSYDLAEMGDYSLASYYTGKANAASQVNSVELTKQNYITSLNSMYSNLTTIGQNIKVLQNQIADAQKSLDAKKVKYEKGFVSELEIEKDEVTLEEMQLNLIELINNHNSLKAAIRKPWVSFY